MEQITEKEKKGFKDKLIGFQLKGLKSYGQYLEEQLEFAKKKDNRKSYLKYIEDQIMENNKTIDGLDS